MEFSSSYCCDPKALITPEGKVLISALAEGNNHAGILLQGPVDGLSLTDTIIKSPTRTSQPMDRPILAYDANSRIIYIAGWIVYFGFDNTANREIREPGLFVSRDEGKSFSELKLNDEGFDGVPFVKSMDTTLEGSLRGLVLKSSPSGLPGYVQLQLSLLRFNALADNSEIIPGIKLKYFSNLARLSSDGSRSWSVWNGPEMAIDKGNNSPHRGRIYVVWSQPETIIENDPTFEFNWPYGSDFDIFLAYSDDDGISWSRPLMVNDDATSRDQVFPSLKIDNTGNAHISFIDRRETSNALSFDVYYAVLRNGQISKNIRVNPEHSPLNGSNRDPGDYMDMVVGYPTKVYVTYPCAKNIVYKGRELKVTDTCVAAIDPTIVPVSDQIRFLRGDSNHDGTVDMSDAIFTLTFLFSNPNKAPACMDAADANDDGQVDISDAIEILKFLFQGDPKELKPPFPYLGLDLTADNLTCNQ